MGIFSRPLSRLLPLLLALAAAPAPASLEAERCAAALGNELVSQGTPLQDSFKVLSWNIQKASNEGWREDLARFASDIHLAFIQEASVQAPIAQTIPLPVYQAFAAGYTTTSQETGVLTLSTGSPSLHCNLTALEPWLGTPKATSITEYPIRQRPERLLAINMHAVNFAMGLEDFRLQIHALSAVLASHHGPVIIAGDLNTWSEGRQTLVDDFMQTHGLLPVEFTPDLRTTAFGYALDHIYVRGLRAESAEVIPVASSDHNPLLVRLQIL
jgi:endonuclease/exonuclease/phosphatase (EEP) superfamily protein YafD